MNTPKILEKDPKVAERFNQLIKESKENENKPRVKKLDWLDDSVQYEIKKDK